MSKINTSSVVRRMNQLARKATTRDLARATGHDDETTRRYLRGDGASLDFVMALCKHFGVSVNWLLTGRGPKLAEPGLTEAVKKSGTPELLKQAVAQMERLIERIDGLESRIFALETRMSRGAKGTVEIKPPAEIVVGFQGKLARNGDHGRTARHD